LDVEVRRFGPIPVAEFALEPFLASLGAGRPNWQPAEERSTVMLLDWYWLGFVGGGIRLAGGSGLALRGRNRDRRALRAERERCGRLERPGRPALRNAVHRTDTVFGDHALAAASGSAVGRVHWPCFLVFISPTAASVVVVRKARPGSSQRECEATVSTRGSMGLRQPRGPLREPGGHGEPGEGIDWRKTWDRLG
jgi:hypothetical protein